MGQITALNGYAADFYSDLKRSVRPPPPALPRPPSPDSIPSSCALIMVDTGAVIGLVGFTILGSAMQKYYELNFNLSRAFKYRTHGGH